MSRRHTAGICGIALFLASLVLFAAGCQPLPAPTPPAGSATATLPGPLDLTIVHSNDTWGYVSPCGWSPAVGGVARRATEIKAEKSNNKNVLVLDAGNSLLGDRDPGQKTQGGSGIEAMNRMGYDAMALGDQDLALGPLVLKQRIAEAKFAILSANAVDGKTNELIGQPYVIREIGGHRVAIIGLSGAGDQDTVTLRDPVETAKAAVAELAGKADVIIVLSHAGVETDEKIADTVLGIDVIVGSGSGMLPDPWKSNVTGTLRWQADSGSQGHAGRNVGIGQLKIDSSGKLVDNSWRRQAMGPDVTGDPDMSAWVEEVLK